MRQKSAPLHVDRMLARLYFLFMNKADLVEKIAATTKFTKTDIEITINRAIELIKVAVKEGDDVTLVGFGTFTRSLRQERKGRNPQTGKEIRIPSVVMPKFRPGKEFRKELDPN